MLGKVWIFLEFSLHQVHAMDNLLLPAGSHFFRLAVAMFRTLVSVTMLSAFTAWAGEPKPASEVAKRIDAEIEKHLAASKMAPAPQSDDAEFLRLSLIHI